MFKHPNTKWIPNDILRRDTDALCQETQPMAINRRNILITLGAVVGGGGALVGTGAFTTVSAARSVDVNTAGDASAFLTITGDGTYVTDDSDNGTLTIDLGGSDSNGFNQEAITTLDGVVTITNNAADDSSATVGVSTADPGEASANGSATLKITDEDGNGVAVVTFYVGDEDTKTETVSAGNSVELDVEIDTRQSTIDSSSAQTGGLTIIATES